MFDLEQFRDLAFRRSALPDHPLRSVRDAEKAVAELPDDALTAPESMTGRQALAHMLRLPVTSAIWEKIHRRHGTQLDIPLATGKQRIRVVRIAHAGDSYQRVVYEPLKT